MRYILTCVTPPVGCEGPLLGDVRDASPERRGRLPFEVAGTPSGRDGAALIDRFGGRQRDGRPGDDVGRACH